MGKSRILGNKAQIKVLSGDGATPITIGEIDKFTATNKSEVKTSQPLGQGYVTSQSVFKGWDISLEAGKVDWQLALQIVAANDTQTVQTGRSAQYIIDQTIEYYDGSTETWRYVDVTFFGYEFTAEKADEEVKESIKGFSGRERELVDAVGQLATDAAAVPTTFGNILAYIQSSENWNGPIVNKTAGSSNYVANQGPNNGNP